MRAHGDSYASSVIDTFAQPKTSDNSFLMVARRIAWPLACEKVLADGPQSAAISRRRFFKPHPEPSPQLFRFILQLC